MTWYGWVLIGLQIAVILASISAVGVHRQPITPGSAIGSTVVAGLVILGAVAVGTGHLR